ncbi:hypothetical protein EJ03DRAFT_55833 [Teratosphaeria nubilosa]|uniref:Uncharacterized protein n=1 Tax=Teratosphaeria nubilosa TaxID=161662 RepID=A0A6G1LDV9_9PEZI|nr:hypothetical protein EJ03DRAFT_55833 [Teratosphaeria nubilosa]
MRSNIIIQAVCLHHNRTIFPKSSRRYREIYAAYKTLTSRPIEPPPITLTIRCPPLLTTRRNVPQLIRRAPIACVQTRRVAVAEPVDGATAYLGFARHAEAAAPEAVFVAGPCDGSREHEENGDEESRSRHADELSCERRCCMTRAPSRFRLLERTQAESAVNTDTATAMMWQMTLSAAEEK